MNETPLSPAPAAPPRVEAGGTGGFTAWPLLISLSGLLGIVALFLEGRPDANGSDFDYPVTAEDVLGVDYVPYRISGAVGYLLVIVLLVTAACWRHRVERRFPGSVGATVVGYGVVATAGITALAYGWRGALGNYLPKAMEENTYDAEGLYNYFIMTDFSPYIAFVPLLASAYALAWMAFRERLVSRALGAAAGLVATLLLGAVLVLGVPGLPAMIMLALIVAGIWLAVGRSPITASRS